jgi:hypothetical protein
MRRYYAIDPRFDKTDFGSLNGYSARSKNALAESARDFVVMSARVGYFFGLMVGDGIRGLWPKSDENGGGRFTPDKSGYQGFPPSILAAFFLGVQDPVGTAFKRPGLTVLAAYGGASQGLVVALSA